MSVNGQIQEGEPNKQPHSLADRINTILDGLNEEMARDSNKDGDTLDRITRGQVLRMIEALEQSPVEKPKAMVSSNEGRIHYSFPTSKANEIKAFGVDLLDSDPLTILGIPTPQSNSSKEELTRIFSELLNKEIEILSEGYGDNIPVIYFLKKFIYLNKVIKLLDVKDANALLQLIVTEGFEGFYNSVINYLNSSESQASRNRNTAFI